MMKRIGRVEQFDRVFVRDISLAVYKERLEADSGKGAVARMIRKHGDNGERLREYAGAYDKLTRSYLRAIGRGNKDETE